MADVTFPYPFFQVQFKADGTLFQQSDVDALMAGLAKTPKATDLFVLSHGWNNNMDQAKRLYSRLLENVAKQVQSSPDLKDRSYAICGVLWPSKEFDEADLIPGGAASLNDSISPSHLRQRVEDLRAVVLGTGWPGAIADAAIEAKLDEIAKSVDQWEDRQSVRERIVELLREILPKSAADGEDASATFFALKPAVVLEHLARSLTPPPIKAGTGAASIDPFSTQKGGGVGGAAGFRDVFGGVKGAFSHLANFTTYYQMKARAGDVGVKGVAPVVEKIRTVHADIRLHLIGHSFGCRLVTAVVNALPASDSMHPNTMTLLQGAFSHNGFAANYDGKNNDGAFRQVVAQKRVRGPVLITHTRNDKAVGIAYPIASRLAGQAAAALGDENDIFGGMGSNGAQTPKTTPEAIKGTLLAVGGAYPFTAGPTHGKLYNLQGDAFISGHSDVTSEAVAYAIMRGMETQDAS